MIVQIHRKWFAIAMLALVSGSWVLPAYAAPVYSAYYRLRGSCDYGGGMYDDDTVQDATSVSTGINLSQDYYSSTIYRGTSTAITYVSAGPGELKLTGNVQATSDNNGGVSSAVEEMEAYFLLDDVIFTSVSNPGDTSQYISAKLNVHVSGAFGSGERGNEQFSLQFYRYYWQYAGMITKDGPVAWHGTLFDGLGNYDMIDGDFQIDLGTIQTGVPQTIGLKIVSMVNTSADTTDTETSHYSDFGDTVRFPESGVVFDLPAGYTINSSSGMIVDNVVVPEPMSLFLLAMGGLLLNRRHRHR